MDELFDMYALPIIAITGTCVLMIFKVAGWITWDWIWVLSPTWILLAIIIIVVIIDMTAYTCKQRKKK